MQPVTPLSENETINLFGMLHSTYVVCVYLNADNILWGSDHCDVEDGCWEQV